MLQLMVIALVIGWFSWQYTFKNRLKWKQRAETLKGVGRYLAADARALLRKPTPPIAPQQRTLTDAEWDAFLKGLDDE